MKSLIFILLVLATFLSLGNDGCGPSTSAERADVKRVQRQQKQCAIGQPIPAFNWSLERHLVIELYKVRNSKVSTHSVWRSDYGTIEGDCPSYGYGIPYDTSITNPLMATGNCRTSITTIEQDEPNCLFASKNTQATWVMCLNDAGRLEPVYVETKVTVYPGPVAVDYEKNTVTRIGAPTVLISKE